MIPLFTVLMRERIFKDGLNPLEVYDPQEIKDLFRFERESILNVVNSILDDLRPMQLVQLAGVAL